MACAGNGNNGAGTRLLKGQHCDWGQETFGAMAKTEKIAYILEQVRLCLDRKDFVRCAFLGHALVNPLTYQWQSASC